MIRCGDCGIVYEEGATTPCHDTGDEHRRSKQESCAGCLMMRQAHEDWCIRGDVERQLRDVHVELERLRGLATANLQRAERAEEAAVDLYHLLSNGGTTRNQLDVSGAQAIEFVTDEPQLVGEIHALASAAIATPSLEVDSAADVLIDRLIEDGQIDAQALLREAARAWARKRTRRSSFDMLREHLDALHARMAKYVSIPAGEMTWTGPSSVEIARLHEAQRERVLRIGPDVVGVFIDDLPTPSVVDVDFDGPVEDRRG